MIYKAAFAASLAVIASELVDNELEDYHDTYEFDAVDESDNGCPPDNPDCERRFKEVTNWLHGKTGMGGLVDTDLSPAEFNKKLRNYGCHCYNAQDDTGRWNRMSGQGPAVDEFDRACKNLKKCRICVKQDYPDYNIDLDGYRADWDGGACFHVRNSPAQNDMCECDYKFAQDIANAWVNDDETTWNADYLGDAFTGRSDQCKGNPVNVLDQCCGDYPYRLPYASTAYQCCNGGIKSIGSC